MRKQILLSFLLTVSTAGLACTNFIVGKKASTDGSVICTYNADDYGMFQNLCHFAAATHQKGTMRQVYDWDTGEYHGEIPEAPVTYNVIGNINEYQVTIGETTYGGREEMIDPTGLLDYGSLIYITLQRSRSAREAISVMTNLAETYGYNSSGETFTICDANEAWIMEMMGKGSGSKGVVWVAMRVPDDAICAHANQSRIGKFDMKDKKNVLYSKDVVKYARSKGWYSGKDSDFSWKWVYAAPDFGGRRFCDARVWAFFHHFDKGFDRYLPWALGKDPKAEDMPLWIIPDHKVSVQEVEACMRDHYEGTALATDTLDMGGGIWQMPYRPTPLSFKVNGQKYFNERPTSTQQTGFSYVSQMRSWLPREIGGVMWWGNDDGNMVAYTPVYCGNTVQPECYNTPGADAVTFSDKNAFWVCNWVSNMVYPRYSQMFPSLQEVRDSLEKTYFELQPAVEAKAKALYASDKAAALKYLNEYSNEKAQQMLARWKQLAVYLIVKYNDMAVKPTENGKFLRTKTGLGAKVIREGFPEEYARRLVKETRDKFRQPE
ncbi:dipeptidase [Prevotella sp. KH2C16]|uniref:dipeptidase n=1 Tax=Prevotella sp. KH2C16 TaxID=1855325 RepID=UPI0008E44489|nr:C69 family dipeptidase [Prevotella sp. KH2C16]SFG10144.1 Dipeptidase [Prevotella sp. KH2C16]